MTFLFSEKIDDKKVRNTKQIWFPLPWLKALVTFDDTVPYPLPKRVIYYLNGLLS
jgi:hypothetical protein